MKQYKAPKILTVAYAKDDVLVMASDNWMAPSVQARDNATSFSERLDDYDFSGFIFN